MASALPLLPAILSWCRVTVNRNEVGGNCDAGRTLAILVDDHSLTYARNLNSFSVNDQQPIGRGEITSVTIESDGSYDCEVRFFDDTDYKGCFWSTTLPVGCSHATSQKFKDRINNDAGSLIAFSGSSEADANPENVGTCSNVRYETSGCMGTCHNRCEALSDSPWVCNSEALPSSPPSPPPTASRRPWWAQWRDTPMSPPSCTVTFNEKDVGADDPLLFCGEQGSRYSVEAALGEAQQIVDFDVTSVHSNTITSIKIESDGSAECEVTLFKGSFFQGCHWRIKLPAGCGGMVSKVFQGTIQNSANSAIVRYGQPSWLLADPAGNNPEDVPTCAVSYKLTECGSCDDRCGTNQAATCISYKPGQEAQSRSVSETIALLLMQLRDIIADVIPKWIDPANWF